MDQTKNSQSINCGGSPPQRSFTLQTCSLRNSGRRTEGRVALKNKPVNKTCWCTVARCQQLQGIYGRVAFRGKSNDTTLCNQASCVATPLKEVNRDDDDDDVIKRLTLRFPLPEAVITAIVRLGDTSKTRLPIGYWQIGILNFYSVKYSKIFRSYNEIIRTLGGKLLKIKKVSSRFYLRWIVELFREMFFFFTPCLTIFLDKHYCNSILNTKRSSII